MKEFYENLCKELISEIKGQVKDAKNVTFACGNFCPYICFINVDFLEKKDWPNNIAENSVYIGFRLDFSKNDFELFRYGHVYLSPKDKQKDKYKYLCMKSVINVLVDKGGKKMRKNKHKDIKITAKKISEYCNTVMEAVNEYTGGYPFKQGIEE